MCEVRADEATGIRAIKLGERVIYLQQRLDWHGANPKSLPKSELLAHIRRPSGDNVVVNQSRARIRNRATAIRAYCMDCQGEMIGVRECNSITCPLHPFRMGKDPLRGFELPKVEIVFETDEDDALFDDGGDGDDADTEE